MTQPAQHDLTTMTLNPTLDVVDPGEIQGQESSEAAQSRLLSRIGLAGRWFVLVFAIVFLLELLVAIPLMEDHRRTWLSERSAVARAAALLLDASPTRAEAQEDRARTMLDDLGIKALALEGPGGRRVLGSQAENNDTKRIDLGAETFTTSLTSAVSLVFASTPPAIWIVARAARPPVEGTDHRLMALGAANGSLLGQADVLLDQAPLQKSLRGLLGRLVLAFLGIAAASAGLVALAVQRDVVRPMRRLAGSIRRFASDPEGVDHGAVPARRDDAIGEAEAAFAKMQLSLAGERREQHRLAGLGLSVSKINHELRNLLTTAQLLGDRLEGVADPVVQRVGPRLIATLDRAIRFCEATLAYGRATEPYPQRRNVLLEPLLREMEDLAGLSADARLRVEVSAEPDLSIHVDPEQFSRVLTNIVRNAVQALDAAGTKDVEPLVTITAFRQKDSSGSRVVVLLADNGPGLPQNARATLFAPFQGSMRAGGTGLGLAIASELVRLNGGTLDLDECTAGACFRIVVPEGKTA